MNEEQEVLQDVTTKLENAGILYMVSGSIAANYYTIPRMTRDIDIVIELTPDDIDSFVNCYCNDYYIDKDMIKDELKHEGMFNIIHNRYIIKIDFIIRKKTEFQESTFKRRKKVTIANTMMWIISAEDLIIMKLLWAKDSFSGLQIKDIRNLFQTEETLDIVYIEEWIKQLGLQQIYKKTKE